jgi:hypothetical protein
MDIRCPPNTLGNFFKCLMRGKHIHFELGLGFLKGDFLILLRVDLRLV